jgi:hypothetical protein
VGRGGYFKRARASSVLCQLRRGIIPEHEFLFRDESFALLTAMLEKVQIPAVQYSTICGRGHVNNALAIPLVLRYRDCPKYRVRYAATFALHCYPNHERSIEALLKLTSDPARRDPRLGGLQAGSDGRCRLS